MFTRFTPFRFNHLKTVLMWLAVWTIVVIGFRLLAWSIGFACEETVCRFI